jgi:hypothetical protein
MHLSFTITKTPRVLSTLAVLAVLLVPAFAQATSGGGGDTGADETGPGGDVGSGGAGSGDVTGSSPTTGMTAGSTSAAGSGETGDTGSTSGNTSGETENPSGPMEDDKGCAIGSRGTAPGLLVLLLLGARAIRRRA